MKTEETLEGLRNERNALHDVVHEFVSEVNELHNKIKLLEESQCCCNKGRVK